MRCGDYNCKRYHLYCDAPLCLVGGPRPYLHVCEEVFLMREAQLRKLRDALTQALTKPKPRRRRKAK